MDTHIMEPNKNNLKHNETDDNEIPKNNGNDDNSNDTTPLEINHIGEQPSSTINNNTITTTSNNNTNTNNELDNSTSNNNNIDPEKTVASKSPSSSSSSSNNASSYLLNEELTPHPVITTALLTSPNINKRSSSKQKKQNMYITTTSATTHPTSHNYHNNNSNPNNSNSISNNKNIYNNINTMSASTVKVIKGEIHNILSVMRADPRYASPLRFLEYSSSSNNHSTSTTLRKSMKQQPALLSSSDEVIVHPLIWSLRDLSTKLSFAEQSSLEDEDDDDIIDTTQTKPKTNTNLLCDVVTYITPFCTAIISRDISANVTGAAISSLHKFLLYDFITMNVPRASEGITLIARSIRHCTFEEEEDNNIDKRSRGVMIMRKNKSSAGTTLMQSNSQNALSKHNSKINSNTKTRSAVSVGGGKTTTGCGMFYNDEEVVLKLLSLSSLVIRCDAGVACLAPKDIVGIFETCLHVACFATHASILLQSAAGDTLAHIILAVFGRTSSNTTSLLENINMDDDKEETPAIVTIMTKLVHLIDPTQVNVPDSTCILSLSWINIALETGSTHLSKYPLILSILQNDLCKHLLRLSTTTDLVILQLTLRVIFNLFNSIKDHLKIQLEVFLQSVFFRLLSQPSILPQNKELVLESLLEFCHEPALMHDLYINYDCDMDCTNLFEKICLVLCEQAYSNNDNVGSSGGSEEDGDLHLKEQDEGEEDDGNGSHTFNVLNQLALEGLLVVIDSIARRCHVNTTTTTLNEMNNSSLTSLDSSTDTDSSSVTSSNNDGDNNNTHNLLQLPSEEDQHQRYHPILLQERKRKKHSLRLAVSEFNNPSSNEKEWIPTLESLNVLPTPATSQSIAKFFYSKANNLDKTKIGLYISKGPKEKYPFHLDVLKEYLNCFDFSNFNFDDALRFFLGRFRLPGEAQCIDRLMEAFAHKIFISLSSSDVQQQQQNQECLFRNADAVYVLAFSTIMLNTDLHNPNMAEDKRMTCEQFIQNNRGINDGMDLPRDFLASLYENIAQNEIQVEQDQQLVLGQELNDGNDVILLQAVDADGLFDSSNDENNTVSSFTPSKDLFHKVGVHERDMFNCMATSALTCLSNIFLLAHDDVVVVKALVGLQQMARVSVYFGLDQVLNDILKQLLRYGKNYVTSFIFAKILLSKEDNESTEELDEEDYESFLEEQPVPSSLLFHKGNHLLGSSSTTHPNYYYHFSKDIVQGSATHRGLLSLHSALTLIKSFTNYVREAWPDFIQCLFVLRDANVLMPISLSELDDFADSSGVVLPPSKFAIGSIKIFREYFESEEGDYGDGEDEGEDGYFWSLFSNKAPSQPADTDTADATNTSNDAIPINPFVNINDDSPNALTPIKDALQKISSSAQLDTILIGATTTTVANRCKDQIIRSLLDFATTMQEDENNEIDSIFQHHAVFALELAARSLLTTNRQRIVEVFPIFYSKLQYILKNSHDMECFYLMERAVITILRACIHLYDIAEMRDHLELSLSLLIDLPSSVLSEIADRLGCGMAIILRSSFYHIPNTHKSWSLIYDLLRMTASCSQQGRRFVFDGITSTIEFASSSSDNYRIPSEGCAVFATLLCNFISGTYDDMDTAPFSSSSPLCEHAMVCLQTVFLNLCAELPTGNHEILWKQIVISLYNCCTSSSQVSSSPQMSSRQGFQILHQILFTTLPADQTSDEAWLDLLKFLSSSLKEIRPTSASIIFSNMKTLDLISRMLLLLLPQLSQQQQNFDILQSIIIQNVIIIVQQNIQQKHDEMLCEGTIHLVRNMSNVLLLSKESFSSDMDTNSTNGDTGGYCELVANTLLAELEKIESNRNPLDDMKHDKNGSSNVDLSVSSETATGEGLDDEKEKSQIK